MPALFDLTGIYQPGFSQPTNLVPSNDNGLTIRATMANPYPDGVAEPPGSSNGVNTFVGRGIGRLNDDLDYINGQSMRWVLSVQRELPGQWLVEGAYVASRSYDLTTDYALNPVPRQYLSTSNVRDQATIDYLTANVTNPFRGLLPGETLNSNTVQRQQLLRPLSSVHGTSTRAVTTVRARFDSLQGRVTRRFRGGYQFDVAYTWSDFKEKATRLNETDADYEERYQDTHLPHRLVVNGIWEVPFGHGRRFGKDSNAVVNAIAGDWNVSFIWNWQSGRPNMAMGNVYYNGDITQLKTKYTDDPTQPVFDVSGFYFHDAAVQTNGVDDPAKQRADQRIRLANNIRTLPITLGRPARTAVLQLGHVLREGLRSRPRASPVPHRALQRLQQRLLQQPEPRPDQLGVREGIEPEQRAAQHPDWDEDDLLEVQGSGIRDQGSGSGRVRRSGSVQRASEGFLVPDPYP